MSLKSISNPYYAGRYFNFILEVPFLLLLFQFSFYSSELRQKVLLKEDHLLVVFPSSHVHAEALNQSAIMQVSFFP